ncbi:gephyrin-like molybdotransferase receptor GlpR [Kitasatospora sp. NPDC047058]|uniref:divisome protein SepX/GlpR n=1 Tax=Kitasatospora sp. NPDC047058 TaxID=3155620 RepID=UPI0033C3D8FE
MSSSGLIYAVIVGAWAAYLVPMWLRRQDELNEARPTERFSTAIRLLAGRSALERRASRALGDEPRDDEQDSDGPPGRDEAASGDPAVVLGERLDDGTGDAGDAGGSPDAGEAGESVEPGESEEPGDGEAAEGGPAVEREPGHRADRPAEHPADGSAGRRAGVERRALLLARRRRMVSALFLAFALGAVVAAVAGLAFLWVPAVPAALLTLYIGHLRKLERQRYEVKLDRARAAQAAERLRDREQRRTEARRAEQPAPDAPEEPVPGRPHLRLAADPAPAADPGPAGAASASAVAEATEHEEWVDGMRERGAAGPDSWEPVPVPLPTYVTAPVAPRVTRGLDLSAPGTWTAGRPAEARTTPLFDQYAEPSAPEARPRAANE